MGHIRFGCVPFWFERRYLKERTENFPGYKYCWLCYTETMENRKKNYLDEQLIAYSKSDCYPFHMPGHKRQRLGGWTPEEIDITEIDGFDNLHHAEGIIKEGQERLAELAGADQSFYLVNGSTAGILSAICGSVKKGDRILVGRNCHKAVYHAVYLMELKTEYLYPSPTAFGIQGSVPPKQVELKLKQFPDTAAVVITSPTYDGVVSDIASIAEIVHEYDIPLIVDEAHGAHFGFSEDFPKKAVSLGADLCIESFHKTLPSYTQTAVLHMKKTQKKAGYRFDPERIKRYLGIYQSSSPSYVFMAGIDRCVRMLQQDMALYGSKETRERSLFGIFERRLRQFYRECGRLRHVQVFPYIKEDDSDRKTGDTGIWRKDNSKILISAEGAGFYGQQLYDLLLHKYHLQMEMASGHYVTALTTIMDTEDGFERLLRALQEIDLNEAVLDDAGLTPLELYQPRIKRMEIARAMNAPKQRMLLEQSAGCISGEFIYLYPPGIPIVAPGELITESTLHLITVCRQRHMQVQGMEDLKGEYVLSVNKQVLSGR